MAIFRHEHGPAIDADGLVATSVYLNSREDTGEENRRGFLAEAGIRLEGAQIGRELLCSGARITAGEPDRMALDAGHVVVGGNLYLDSGLVAKGQVGLEGAHVTGAVDCTWGTFSSECGPAIDASRLVAREIRFSNARITAGEPEPWGAVAIRAFEIEVGGLFLDFGCEVRGSTVQLVRARATGDVYFVFGCRVEAPDGIPSIDADGAEFGSLFFQGHFTGEVSLKGAAIRRELNCTGGQFRNAQGYALRADHITCEDVYLNRRREVNQSFVAEGMVSFWGATLAFLDLREGTVSGGRAVQPRSVTAEGYGTYALDLAETQVKHHVWAQGATVEGGLRVAAANVLGDLDLSEAWITPNAGEAQGAALGDRASIDTGVTLNGSNVSVRGYLHWRPKERPGGRVLLNEAKVWGLEDNGPESWPGRGDLDLRGFRYERLIGEVDVRKRLEWLNLSDYSSDPYNALVSCYRKNNRENAARKVAISRERRSRVNLPLHRRVSSSLYGHLLGYGYSLSRVLLLLTLLYAITVPAVLYAQRHDAFVLVTSASGRVVTADRCTHDYPCLSSFAYPIDFIVPIISLRQKEYWQPDARNPVGHVVRNWLYLATALGWGTTTLFVGAFTGLIRKD